MADEQSAETAHDPLLGRYRIEGPLGEGGLGTVVQAFDTRLKRMVAIKTLKRASYATDPDQFRALEERFAREAEAGSRMGSHPHLVGVHDLVIDADRTQYLILEYIAGGTLAERIARGALPRPDALRIAGEVAQGLRAAHAMGLVHRDIKPANIFLTASGQAKVGDFGIAQIDDLSGRTRATAGHPGTPLYMSPEQERMTAYLRPSSDQYSLGLVLFEMLTGRGYKRIGARQAAELLAAQPAPLPALIARMLADDPDDRYPAMEDVIRAMQAVERRQASAETQVLTRLGRASSLSDDTETLIAARHDTPRVGLQPMPPVIAYAPPPALPVAPRYSRRAVLIGAGGLVLAAGTAGAAMRTLGRGGGAVATATVGTTAVAAAPIAQPSATATIGPTATGVPTATAPVVIVTATATAPVPAPAPIIITAPPIVITATPLPPTAIIITAPPIVITATPQPLPPTPLPTATVRPSTAVSTPAVTQTQLVTWTDPQGRFQVGYPPGWQPTKNPSPSVVEFVGQGIGLEILAFVNASSTPTEQIDNIRANRPTSRTYRDGQTESATVGGESGAFMQFKSFGIGNSADVHEGAFWVVKHGGTLYQLNGYTLGPATDQWIATINSIVRSFAFLH